MQVRKGGASHDALYICQLGDRGDPGNTHLYERTSQESLARPSALEFGCLRVGRQILLEGLL